MLRASVLSVACCLLLAWCPSSSSSSPSPAALDGFGSPVDWWFVLKLPQKVLDSSSHSSSSHCACRAPVGCAATADASGRASGGGSGLCYLYADSRNSALQHFSALGYDCLGQGGNDPLSQTLRQLRSSANWAFWNDEFSALQQRFPDEQRHRCAGSDRINAHSKGSLAFDDDGDGFFLQSSIPNFPDPSFGSAEFVKLGCQRESNLEFSQHLFAVSLDAAEFDKLGIALKSAGLCSANRYSDMTSLLLSKSLQNLDSPIAQALYDSSPSTMESVSDRLHTRFQRIPLHVMVKNKKTDVPPWAMVAHMMKKDISVATWWDAVSGIPSICHGDQYQNAKSQFCLVDRNAGMKLTDGGTTRFNIENLAEASWIFPDGRKYFWKLFASVPAGNHAKWGIATPRNGKSSLVMFGDMNMEGFPCSTKCSGSQEGRGGTFFSIAEIKLWNSLRRKVIEDESVCSCVPSMGNAEDYIKQRMCGKGCEKKIWKLDPSELPTLSGESSTFWHPQLRFESF